MQKTAQKGRPKKNLLILSAIIAALPGMFLSNSKTFEAILWTLETFEHTLNVGWVKLTIFTYKNADLGDFWPISGGELTW